LTSAINLFPYTTDSLRDSVVSRLSRKLPVPGWGAVLKSDLIFKVALTVAGRFDNRAGRLYSFVGHKTRG